MARERSEQVAGERLEALFRAHRVRLFALALRLTGRRDQALDLVQETFLRAARRVRTIPGGEAAERRWLTRVLVNVARDDWRRWKRRRVAGQGRDRAAAGGSPERDLAVREALVSLAPRRRAIVVLAEMEGRTSTEIAALLGIPEATVRWHLAVARRRLRALLHPWLRQRRWGEGPGGGR